MDQRLVAHLKFAAAAEDKPEPHDVNYHKVRLPLCDVGSSSIDQLL